LRLATPVSPNFAFFSTTSRCVSVEAPRRIRSNFPQASRPVVHISPQWTPTPQREDLHLVARTPIFRSRLETFAVLKRPVTDNCFQCWTLLPEMSISLGFKNVETGRSMGYERFVLKWEDWSFQRVTDQAPARARASCGCGGISILAFVLRNRADVRNQPDVRKERKRT